MQIRVGYELRYTFPQPTPTILTLSIHHSRVADLVHPEHMHTDHLLKPASRLPFRNHAAKTEEI